MAKGGWGDPPFLFMISAISLNQERDGYFL
jgi:hypothetical protein